MLKDIIWKGIILSTAGLIMIFHFSNTSGGEQLQIQGRIMSLDLKKNTMIVNERYFFWDEKTNFYHANGTNIKVDKLKLNSWVYIEGEKDGSQKIRINKIYLLPRHIDKKERHQYPFIQ